MKLGVYGAGMIVNDFLSMYKQVENLQISYICATQSEEEKLKELCAKYDIPKYYLDAEEAFKDNNVDCCYLGVPNHLHYKFAYKALENNHNVIVEKPFTSNYKEAIALKEYAKEKNLIILEAVTTHYFPNMKKIKELIPSLGDIKLVVMNFSKYSSRYDDFKHGTSLPAFDPDKSGGALMDLNIYNLNFILDLFGEPKDIQYFANIEKGIDTSGVLILDYDTFKCVSIAAKDCKAPITTTIQGDKKLIVMNMPVNMMPGYKVIDVSSHGLPDFNGDYENYNDSSKHRMFYEFTEFVRIVNEDDKDSAYKALDVSLITMKMQTLAREKALIKFAAD